MTFNFAPSNSVGTPTHQTLSHQAQQHGVRQPDEALSASLEVTDAERELHILHCGRLLEKAYAEGSALDAHQWMQAMYTAIAARSPAQQARMAAEIEARVNEGVNYFAWVGARDSRALAQGELQ